MGLNPLSMSYFSSPTSGISNVNYTELSNAIFDEFHIRGQLNIFTTTNEAEDWQLDTVLLAKFQGNLEAGNYNNGGVAIDHFRVNRRRIEETEELTLGTVPLLNDANFNFKDYTAPRGTLVYTVVPVGVNGMQAKGSTFIIDVDFSGFHIVDKDTGNVLSFDQFIGSEPTISMTMNKGSVQVDTFSKFPSFYANEQQYHTFQLQATFLKDDFTTLNNMYEFIINKFVTAYKPFLIKGGDGSVYIANVDNASREVPLGIYSQREHMNLNVNCTEIMDYKDYIENKY